MKDSEFTTDIYIYMLDGINARKPAIFDRYYKKLDKNFSNREDIEYKFDFILSVIDKLI